MDLAGGLELWAVRDALRRRALQGTDLSEGGEAWRWALRCGALPLGTPGEVALRALLSEVDAIVQAVRPHLAEPVRCLDLTLPLSRTVLVDQPSLRGERTVAVTASKVRGKRRFSAWLGHLLLGAYGHAVESHVWGNASHVAFGPVAPDQAAGRLERLVQLYGWGLRLPLMWFPEASWSWYRAQRWAKDPEDDLRRGFQSVDRSWSKYSEPDAESRRVLGTRCPFDPAADLSDIRIPRHCQAWELADELWGPVARYTIAEAG